MSFKETEIGFIPEDWNVDSMENSLEAIIDYRGKTPEKSDVGIVTLSAKSVKNGYIDYDSAYYISEDSYKKFMVRGFPQKGDVLLTTEAPLGCVAKLDRDKVGLAQRLLTLRGKAKYLNNDYLRYYLMSEIGQHQLKSRESGTTVTGIKQAEFRKALVALPPYEEQISIGRILSTLDEKIKVNNQINKTLEVMAQALFKQWFIDFEFPNENGEPYKSSGGEMVESELGLIPKGWEVGRFTDVVDVLSGGTPKTTISEYWNGEIPFFTPKDCRDIFCIVTEKYVTDEGVKNCNSQLYEDDTVFITARGTVGNIALAGRPMAMNQSCYALKGKNGLSQYMVYMQTKKIANDLKKNASGSVFDAITVNTFKSQSIVIPKSEIECRFSLTIKNMFEKLKCNQFENFELQSIRNTLLPKLMSGEIRVPIEEN